MFGACSGFALDGSPKSFVRITLAAGARLGGLLTITTCTPATGSRDTTLYVGTGCGQNTANYGCLAGNGAWWEWRVAACGVIAALPLPTQHTAGVL
jgi:hypothetical protein